MHYFIQNWPQIIVGLSTSMLYHSLFHYTIMLHHKLTDDSCCNLFAKERKLPYHIFWKNIKVCDNSVSIKFIYNLISANHSFYQKFE